MFYIIAQHEYELLALIEYYSTTLVLCATCIQYNDVV